MSAKKSPQDDERIRHLRLHQLMHDDEVHEVSLEELQESLAFELAHGDVALGVIPYAYDAKMMRPKLFEFGNRDCVPIPGNTPRVCPKAVPPIPKECLPEIEKKYRIAKIIQEDETVLWVGRQPSLDKSCMWPKCDCFEEPEPDETAGSKSGISEEQIQKIYKQLGVATLDENAQKIMQILSDRKKNADAKMHELAEVDHRYYGFKSPQWEEVLGVTASNVRQSRFWRETRTKYLGDD